ncbi:HPr family phosphocarrier protein [Rhodobacteraceae bacterium WD3A24]|nr:HPr family phosphocarrier protein [Rhodobacteraceae bacterium WD3A24]
MIRREFRICNEKGLHARAAARFVEVVEGHDANVEVSRDGEKVSGDSIMGLLMLAAGKGATISVSIDGPDAEALADALQALIDNRFDEEF